MGLFSLALTVAPAFAVPVDRVPAAGALEFHAGPVRVRGPAVPAPLDGVVDLVSPPTTKPTSPPPAPATTTTTTTTTTPPAPRATPPASTGTATGRASWYDGRKGECAHRTLPKRTVVKVTNLGNGSHTFCTVTNRGPYVAGRIIDLTKGTFAEVALPSRGVIDVRLDW